MTGNEWMFYFSLGAFIVLMTIYLVVRIRIEIKKRKIVAFMKEGE